MELIIVDGSSKDRTMLIIRRLLKGVDLKTKFFTENVGLGFARQLVVDNAEGEYIIWVDDDIILKRNFVEKQVNFMTTHPLAGIGKARYGILRNSSHVAFLENITFVIETLKPYEEIPPEMCVTEGAIYRLSAIRDAGGFNSSFKGAAEDTELAKRILSKGWKAYVTDAVFWELCKESWRDLWNQYVWWGKGWHQYFHKNKEPILLLKMSPIGGFLAGILRFPAAYLLTHRKLLCLLPFHYAFKRIAFCYGVTKAHFEGYGHY